MNFWVSGNFGLAYKVVIIGAAYVFAQKCGLGGIHIIVSKLCFIYAGLLFNPYQARGA